MSAKLAQSADLTPDQIPEGWSRIASVYERAFEKLTTQFSLEALRQLDLKKGERVIDVAAGTGSFSLPAARAGAEVLATDFAPGMIARLHERIVQEGIDNITAEVMDGQELDVSDASYDVSASIVGLIFFPDIDRGLAELKRVLKPGGRCVVVCWDDPETFQMMQYLIKAIELAVPGFEMPAQTPVWARLSGHEQLRQSMSTAGFNGVTITSMTGTLEVESLQQFWQDFTSSAPPLAQLFARLGADNTGKVGEVFIDLIKKNSNGGIPSLTAQACIGVGRA